MTVFGVLWILLMLFCYSKGTKQIIVFTLGSMLFQCNNVISFGAFSVGPQVLASIVYVAYYLVRTKLKIKIIKNDKVLFWSTILLLMAVLISSLANRVLSINAMVCLQLMAYVLCFWCIYIDGSKFSKEECYIVIRKLIIFCLVVGYIQILVTSNIIPRVGIMKTLIYNEYRGAVYFHRNHYFRVLSTFMEPSYYAGFIVGAFYYLLDQKGKMHENRYLLILIALQIVLTFSSTAYGSFLVVGILYILFSKKAERKWTLLIIGLIVALIMYFGFYDVLDRVIFSKGSTGSGMKRNGMNNRALASFWEAPLYGSGYKQFRASSMVICLLAELGIIGFIPYVLMIVSIFSTIIRSVKTKIRQQHTFDASITYPVLAAAACQIIACPDLDLCTFWFWMYCFAIYKSIYNKGVLDEKGRDINIR